MSLIEHTLFGDVDRVAQAIGRLRQFEPPDGYFLAFSGGKDSIVIKALADMSGVKYDAHYSMTTIDPPELVTFIKEHHPDVEIVRPKESFFQLLVRKGYPTRQGRWCCSLLKEQGGNGRMVVTGIRGAESPRRKRRKMTEHCTINKHKTYLHPIIDWSDGDVWAFIHRYELPYCKLYDEGWKRIGCLFCPMAGRDQRLWEAEQYPKFVKAFIAAFERRHRYAIERGLTVADRFDSGEQMFWWWITDKLTGSGENQTKMFDGLLQ